MTGTDSQMSPASRAIAQWTSFAANPRAFELSAQNFSQTPQSRTRFSSIHHQPESSTAPEERNKSVPDPEVAAPTLTTDEDLSSGLSTMSIEATQHSFESLPPEILAIILENLTYRRDLWTLTETVPAARRTFVSAREQVLTKVGSPR